MEAALSCDWVMVVFPVCCEERRHDGGQSTHRLMKNHEDETGVHISMVSRTFSSLKQPNY